MITCGLDTADRFGDIKFPTTGTTVAFLEASCGLDPKHTPCLGKPNPKMVELIRDRDKIDLSKSVIVGDKLESDILCAKRAGISSIMPLTGVDSRDTIAGKELQPDFVIENLRELLEVLNK